MFSCRKATDTTQSRLHKMASTTALRRSVRTKKPTEKALAALTQNTRVEKRKSPRLALLSKTRKLDKIITTTTCRTTQTHMSDFIVDNDTSSSTTSTASDSESESDDSDTAFEDLCPFSTEPEERAALTSDDFEFRAADLLDRRDSYDSRLEPGNDEYQLDDFIVGDGSEDEVSSVGSEITVESDESDSDTTVHVKRRSTVESTTRHVSKVSVASSGSGLFVTDSSNPQSRLTPVLPIGFKAVAGGFAPADVAEEINDAVARFGRRCNRHLPPLRLELSEGLFNDEEVAEAMERSVKQGLGRVEMEGAGKVLFTIGPAI
jgi:hypothetical protein